MPVTAKQHSTTTPGQKCKFCRWFLQLISVLLMGGAITGMTLQLTWKPDNDPRIQIPPNTSLLLDIPEDGHYTYICLHHEDWGRCIQLNQIHRGNITFKITAERTTSEVHHDRSKADIGYVLSVACASPGIVLLICLILIGCICCIWRKYRACCPKNDDDVIYVIEAPPPQTASSPLIAPDVSSRVKQEEIVSEDACSNRVGHSCVVNIISQVDSSFDAGPEFIGTVDGHVKELEEKIKASSYSSEAPLKPRTYDCFIIYSREDEDIVYNKLIPFFISNNIKYCEHQEHFELGNDIFDNANTCIAQSRKVVAVLSKSFFASGYCMMDLDAARGYAASNGYSVQDFLISIKVTDFVFPTKYSDISNSTYADLSEDVTDKRKWLQIRKALTEFRLASVTMRIEMGAKYSAPKSRLTVQDLSVLNFCTTDSVV
uniref:TIRD n=1 Tax=Branchiostoma belcheri tsingtauense TaxID=155462 RepID=A0A0A0U6V4_BRABE|nr:TIRD [Branchiostoma belcheri tsingtauense]